MRRPLVSAVMPTYGRYPTHGHLLAESVYWFARNRSEYPDCELVVLNDAPAQTLVCDVPGVRVVNLAARVPTLGAKCNALLALARGTVIVPWDDDDVSLPGRVAQAVDRLGDADYWNPGTSWWVQGESAITLARMPACVCHNAGAFRRGRLWYRAVHGHDTDADERARTTLQVAPSLGDWRQSEYVYRWGVSDYHLSAQGDQLTGYANAPAPTPGTYRIDPRMGVDYAAAVTPRRHDHDTPV